MNEPSQRDSRGRLLRLDIRPLTAVEAENLRLEARAAGWIVSDLIEQRDGHRPCAYGWQFWLKVPLVEMWHWTHVPNYYWFVFWTDRDLTEPERLARARALTRKHPLGIGRNDA